MALIGQWVFVPLAVLLLILAFWEPARRRMLGCKGIQRLEKRLTLSERGYWAAFALILAAGVWVRCYRFTELPLGMNQDGTMAGVEAFCLLSGGTDQYGTSWPTYFEAWQFSQMSTLYSYLLIPFIKLLGLSKFSLRLPMLLMSLIALPLMWDAARRVAGKNYALAAMFLLALNPWHIVLSRWALEANMRRTCCCLLWICCWQACRSAGRCICPWSCLALRRMPMASQQFRCRSSCCLRRFSRGAQKGEAA